ncbi:DUF943 family protein [Erwinia rhapontici]|uniref:DUF943 family protein n=1 Tax=Erwinia rhapontici TaxID=55212 RepID=UPI003BA3B86A
MLNSSKKRKFMMLLVIIVGGYLLWLWYRPMKVINVHQRGSYSVVLVKDYPFSDREKMKWWLKNKEMLKVKYNTPKPDEDGRYRVILWDFDEGYKEEGKYDRLCFEDMKPPINCVDKNAMMIIQHSKDNITQITVGNEYYILQDNGQFVKRKRN